MQKFKLLPLLLALCLLLAACATSDAPVDTGSTDTQTTATVVTTTVFTTNSTTATTTTQTSTTQTTPMTTTKSDLETTTTSTRSLVTSTTRSTVNTTVTTTRTTTVSVTTTTTKKPVVAPTYEWQSHPQDFKLIAFGFDDLPTSAGNVQMVIDTLAKYEGFGTCFVLGENLEKAGPKMLEYALQNGFEIGNHSYDHSNLSKCSYEEVVSQLRITNALIERNVGVKPKWFRPPYLASNSTIRAACAANGWMHVVNGNKNSTTNTWYNVEDGGNVLRDAVNNAYDGAIYVMHPARTETAISMDEICKQLYDKGYRFCTMSQLFEYKGIEPQYSKTYNDVNG